MANFRAASTLGQRFFIASATITAGYEFAARTISSVAPLCNWVSGSSDIEDGSSSADARGNNEREASYTGTCCVAWAGDSPKFSCFEELSVLACRSALVERLEGGLDDGDSSTQRFTEYFCSRCICIIWLLCLNSLALDTSPSHFLHIRVERESFSAMKIPHTSRIFEATFLSLPAFPALPKHEASGGSQMHCRKAGRPNFAHEPFWESIAP